MRKFVKSESYVNELGSYIKLNSQNRHRSVIVLAGDLTWTKTTARQIIHNLNLDTVFWVSHRPSEGGSPFKSSQLTTKIGQETKHIVFDMFSGFNPKIFTTVAGTLKAGGIFMILCPPFEHWAKFNDPFYATMHLPLHGAKDIPGSFLVRFIKILKSQAGCMIINQADVLDIPHISKINNPRLDQQSALEQQLTVVSIIKSFARKKNNVQVLVANRGRGKSSALGLIAAELMLQENTHIVITGPRFFSVQKAFLHLKKSLNNYTEKHHILMHYHSSFSYKPPDQLCLKQQKNIDILFVDEAATIPLPMLSSLLIKYPRILFSTTLDGYEGTGQGFAIQFRKILDKTISGWERHEMKTPMRWSDNDPLEQLVTQTFLLNTVSEKMDRNPNYNRNSLRFRKIEQDELANNETLLIQAYNLLHAAHYRTTPTDLRNIIDCPSIDIFLMKSEKNILAIGLVSREGEIPHTLADEIYRGKRRIRGHLTPQSLIYHCGIKLFSKFKYARIMRIVTHPDMQRLGIGSQLLENLEQYYKKIGYDYIAASFGLRNSLLNFWFKSGLKPVKISTTKDHASGLYSLLMLKSLSICAKELMQKAINKFGSSLTYVLKEQNIRIDKQLQMQLKPYAIDDIDHHFDIDDKEDLESFINAYRGYEITCYAIFKYVYQLSSSEKYDLLTTQEINFFTMKLLDNISWPSIISNYNFSGKKQAINYLRDCLKKIVHHPLSDV